MTEQRMIAVNGYEIAVRIRGDGPPVLMGHSLTFDSRMFDAQVAALQDKFPLIQIDLPGHGDSGTPKEYFTLEEIADDLAELMDQLGVKKAAWVGHSLGGMVGMRLALQHPDRVSAIALLNTSAEAENPQMRDLYHHVNETSRGKPSDAKTVKFVLELMFSPSFIANQSDDVAPYEEMLFNPKDAEGVYRTAHAVIWRTSVLDDMTALRPPALVLTSADDTSVPAHHGEAILGKVPGARHIHLDNCAHMSCVEQPDAVADALQSFFTGTPNWSEA
ncbi:MAG: hypothetical protein CL928_18895 [Deltaproteobacteria bacterium]|nr:hypothetical protein [Deltaproteobacteria bacterium]